jgi:hypothetical protein
MPASCFETLFLKRLLTSLFETYSLIHELAINNNNNNNNNNIRYGPHLHAFVVLFMKTQM